jgi:Homeodomain-like domain
MVSFARPRARYSGALAEPIVRWGFRFITPEPNEERISREKWEKLGLLFAHYNIRPKDPKGWQKLARCLASKHVPGMQVIDRPRQRKGRPKKWPQMGRQFVELIDRIASERGKGILDAIQIAKKRGKLPESVPGLQTRYYEERSRTRKYRELTARAEAWSRTTIGDTEMERVADALRDGMSIRKAAAELGMSKSKVERLRAKATEQGFVDRLSGSKRGTVSVFMR